MDKYLLAALACTVFIFCPQNEWAAVRASTGKVKTSIPAIAHFGDFTIGLDTVSRLDKVLGAGVSIPGQHPTGGRAWYVKNLGILINADGFYTNSSGEIIDSFSISASEPWHHATTLSSARKLAFMGVVIPGMSKTIALHRLRAILPAPVALKDNNWQGPKREALGWHMKGRVQSATVHRVVFHEWTTTLLFENNRLIEIEAKCD